MDCEELLAAVSDYVESERGGGAWEALEAHLSACPPCRIVVDNIRQTITLFKAGEPYVLPPAQHEHLCQALCAVEGLRPRALI